MAAVPSVNNVRIIGDAIEGNVIKGVGTYFGGREGPSKFEWLREHKENGLVLCIFVPKNKTYMNGNCIAFSSFCSL